MVFWATKKRTPEVATEIRLLDTLRGELVELEDIKYCEDHLGYASDISFIPDNYHWENAYRFQNDMLGRERKTAKLLDLVKQMQAIATQIKNNIENKRVEPELTRNEQKALTLLLNVAQEIKKMISGFEAAREAIEQVITLKHKLLKSLPGGMTRAADTKLRQQRDEWKNKTETKKLLKEHGEYINIARSFFHDTTNIVRNILSELNYVRILADEVFRQAA